MKGPGIQVVLTSSVWGLVSFAMLAPAGAEAPRKQPVTRYAELWTKSPFTVPPVEEAVAAVEENPLEDFTLAGVCEMQGGWYVVLMNKQKREERVRIKPNEENEQGFKVVKVTNGTKFKETRVEISHRGKTGWVEYEDKFLVLKKAVPSAPRGGRGQPNGRPGIPRPPGTPAAPTARQPGQPGQPPIPSRGGPSGRSSRVPTPPSPATSANGNPSGGQPTGARPGGDRFSRGGGRGDRSRGRSSRGRGR